MAMVKSQPVPQGLRASSTARLDPPSLRTHGRQASRLFSVLAPRWYESWVGLPGMRAGFASCPWYQRWPLFGQRLSSWNVPLTTYTLKNPNFASTWFKCGKYDTKEVYQHQQFQNRVLIHNTLERQNWNQAQIIRPSIHISLWGRLGSSSHLLLQVLHSRHYGDPVTLDACEICALDMENTYLAPESSKKAAAKRKNAQRASSNVFSMFEQSQIQEFKEAFGCIDQNRDGVINKSDLKETYAQLGKLNVSDEELEGMLAEGKGPINFTVFLSLFGEKLNGTDPEETILAAFKLFDPNATGFVNKDEFKRLLLTQADKFTADEVEQAFAVAPIDVTGNIDYKSLCYIITHGDEKEES
ncbi:hypothetical protein NFI96_033328 [Prochilodus magdalenae]|nr:hypothetical protein NFI96_033328 [Prochilodus magdalenae]